MARSPRKQLAHADRDATIVALRADSVPPRIIADRYDISQARVCQIWRKALRDRPIEALDDRRREADQMCDSMISKLVPIIDNPTIPPRTKAEVSKVIAMWETRRAQLLGLDAPRRREIQHITKDSVDRAIEGLTTQMRMHNQSGYDDILRELDRT